MTSHSPSLLLFLITVEIAETAFCESTKFPMKSLPLIDSDLHHPSDPAGNHPHLNGRPFAAKAVPVDPSLPSPQTLRSSVAAFSGPYPSPIGKSANWRFDLHLTLETTDALATPTKSICQRMARNQHRCSSS
uniref:Uncharacterized protein n=1 Tax=Cryptomonas curvata TaxID=233186 RepID=A0A7S0MEX9_9CRYP|mmetsp:Transcript_34522/g.72445  ORF Transcript_34522/g.72445 Transcript_34522/m.72445 type:complete len:132 (+) Transcript_34522:38-433(+)